MAGLSLAQLLKSGGGADPSSMSFQDKLQMLGAIIGQDKDQMERIPLLAQARQQAAQQGAAERDMVQFASGQRIPQRPAAFDPTAEPAPERDPANAPGLTLDGFKTPLPTAGVPILKVPHVAIPERDPRADLMGGAVTPKTALPFLARLAPDRAKQMSEMIAAAQPKPKQLANGGDGYLGAFDPEAGTISELHPGTPKHEWKEVKNADGSSRFIDLSDPTGAGQSSSPAVGPAALAPIPTGGIYAQVGQVAEGKGAKPDEVSYLQRLAHVESHGDPGAQNNSSTGLFQFHPDTFMGAGGGNIHNVADQTAAALNLSRRDRANLQAIGIEPSDANVYLMHQQGAGGGRALLTAPPEVGAVAALTPVYGSAKIAEKAIVGNGGTADMTAGQFTDMWRQRWANGGKPVAAPPADQAGPRGIPGSAAQAPDWKSDGKGFLHNANGDVKPDPTYEVGEADPNMVKMVLEGRYPPPTGRAATDPKWQAVLQAASAQDPNFNAADYHTRYATRKDFTSGKAAQNITSLNTAIGHIGELDKQIDGLGNTGIPMLNTAKNWIETATGDPRVGNFNTTKSAVASELVRVFRQAGGTEADIQDFQKPLAAANSPAQLKGVVREMTKLLASRLDAMASQYRQGLGQDKSGIEFLNPKAQATFSRIMGVPLPDAPAGAPAGGSGAQRLSPADAAKLPPGTKFIGLDGVARVRH